MNNSLLIIITNNHYSIMEEKILNQLKKIRQLLADHVNNNINHTTSLKLNIEFPISELVPNIELNKCNIHGVTYIDVLEWISIKPGIKIANMEGITIKKMQICLKNRDGDILPLPAIVHTFIHELAHTITIPELVSSKNISNKRKRIQPTVENRKKNAFMQNHHSDAFYGNFAKLLRIAELLNIYILPKTHRQFTKHNLQRFDSLLDPNDSMSLGEVP